MINPAHPSYTNVSPPIFPNKSIESSLQELLLKIGDIGRVVRIIINDQRVRKTTQVMQQEFDVLTFMQYCPWKPQKRALQQVRCPWLTTEEKALLASRLLRQLARSQAKAQGSKYKWGISLISMASTEPSTVFSLVRSSELKQEACDRSTQVSQLQSFQMTKEQESGPQPLIHIQWLLWANPKTTEFMCWGLSESVMNTFQAVSHLLLSESDMSLASLLRASCDWSTLRREASIILRISLRQSVMLPEASHLPLKMLLAVSMQALVEESLMVGRGQVITQLCVELSLQVGLPVLAQLLQTVPQIPVEMSFQVPLEHCVRELA